MTTATERKVIDVFVDAGLLTAATGTVTQAATTLADRLIADGHGAALGELTVAFWSANDARLARRDRWGAYSRERATLDPGESEPPPLPPVKDPPPVQPPPPPPTDHAAPPVTNPTSAPTASGTGVGE